MIKKLKALFSLNVITTYEPPESSGQKAQAYILQQLALGSDFKDDVESITLRTRVTRQFYPYLKLFGAQKVSKKPVIYAKLHGIGTPVIVDSVGNFDLDVSALKYEIAKAKTKAKVLNDSINNLLKYASMFEKLKAQKGT